MTQIRPYTPPDRAAVAQLNITYYTRTHAFDESFAQAVSDALDAIDHAIAGNTRQGWVVIQDNTPKGSLFLTPDGPAAARLRLFLLDPSLQGRGLGREMLAAALQTARSLGFARLNVSTFTIHPAACALYARAGFSEASRHPRRAFGHALTQVDFTRAV
ncbi:GNAT family N-acetyltransferase [Gymnodinialimonas sp.]